MPSVSLLNTEWRKVCSSIRISLKGLKLKEQRIMKEVSSLLEPYNMGEEKVYPYQLGSIVYWARETYTCSSKNKTLSDSELHKLWATIKRLEELQKEAQAIEFEYQELEFIYQKLEVASKKRNGIFEIAVGSSSGGSSSSSGNSIDDTILTDPWGY